MQALFRLYSGSIQAPSSRGGGFRAEGLGLKLYSGSVKALLRLHEVEEGLTVCCRAVAALLQGAAGLGFRV
jgi:hypothetical protein